MTSTVEIIKVLLDDLISLDVLRLINTKECTFVEVLDEMPQYSEKQIKKAVIYLDKVGLILSVLTRSRSFYRIGARGERILEITEEAVIEEGNING